jgi:triacylglycerol lipase
MRVPGAGRLAGLSPRRRRFVAGSYAVVAVLVILASLQAAGTFSSPVRGQDSARISMVVLVPGYGGATAGLDVLAAHIRRTGKRTEVVSLPGNGTGDLLIQATVLNDDVDEALRTFGGRVDVIGFSAGGVVARLWDIEDDGAQKANKIITLGSPLNGTRLAAAGNAVDPSACPTACQELVPGSTLLTTLRRTPFTGRPSWLSLWSVDDQVIRPPDSSLLPGAVNVPLQDVCPGLIIEHGQLPTEPLVIGMVLRALGSGPLRAPTQADCASLQSLGERS